MRISILHVQPGCGAYGNRIWLFRDDWFDKISEEIKDKVRSLVMWGNYDKEGYNNFGNFRKRERTISFEIENSNLGAVVSLLVTGK